MNFEKHEKIPLYIYISITEKYYCSPPASTRGPNLTGTGGPRFCLQGPGDVGRIQDLACCKDIVVMILCHCRNDIVLGRKRVKYRKKKNRPLVGRKRFQIRLTNLLDGSRLGVYWKSNLPYLPNKFLVAHKLSPSRCPMFGRKSIETALLPLPTRTRLILSCIRPCSLRTPCKGFVMRLDLTTLLHTITGAQTQGRNELVIIDRRDF